MTAKERHNKRAVRRRAIVAAHKLELGCVDCGYNKNALTTKITLVNHTLGNNKQLLR